MWKIRGKIHFIHNGASLQCFSFIVNGKGPIILSTGTYFGQHIEIFWKKVKNTCAWN
jgi:hypothetical protein